MVGIVADGVSRSRHSPPSLACERACGAAGSPRRSELSNTLAHGGAAGVQPTRRISLAERSAHTNCRRTTRALSRLHARHTPNWPVSVCPRLASIGGFSANLTLWGLFLLHSQSDKPSSFFPLRIPPSQPLVLLRAPCCARSRDRRSKLVRKCEHRAATSCRPRHCPHVAAHLIRGAINPPQSQLPLVPGVSVGVVSSSITAAALRRQARSLPVPAEHSVCACPCASSPHHPRHNSLRHRRTPPQHRRHRRSRRSVFALLTAWSETASRCISARRVCRVCIDLCSSLDQRTDVRPPTSPAPPTDPGRRSSRVLPAVR